MNPTRQPQQTPDKALLRPRPPSAEGRTVLIEDRCRRDLPGRQERFYVRTAPPARPSSSGRALALRSLSTKARYSTPRSALPDSARFRTQSRDRTVHRARLVHRTAPWSRPAGQRPRHSRIQNRVQRAALVQHLGPEPARQPQHQMALRLRPASYRALRRLLAWSPLDQHQRARVHRSKARNSHSDIRGR